MKYISKFAAVFCLALASAQTLADTITTHYDFNSYAYGPGLLPDLNFEGAATGQMTTKFFPEEGQYSLDKVVINFEKMPQIVAQNFIKTDGSSDTVFETHVNNAWIFRSVKVMVHFPDGLEFPRSGYVDISIDYKNDFVGNTSNDMDGPMLVNLPLEPVERRIFSTIDVYKTNYQNKPVILKLNKNPIRKVTEQGWTQEGFELKVTWYGHGEGTFIIDGPAMPGVEPFAIKVEDFTPGGMPERIFVEFNDGDYTSATPSFQLEEILQQAILNSNSPSFP